MLIAQMTGTEAVVRWGYRPAASLGPWRYERGTLTATVVTSDAFALEQGPLIVSAPTGRATWRWLATDVQINGSTFTATVRPQED